MRAWLLVLACAAGCGARTELGSEESGHASTRGTTGSSSSGGGGGSSSSSASSSSSSASSSASSSSSSASSSASSSGGGGASPLSGVVAVSAGGGHTCALTTAGGVLCWGANEQGQLGNGTPPDSPVPVAVSGLSSGVAAVAAGLQHTCAATMAGDALCWGLNGGGELGDDSTIWSNVPVHVSGLAPGVTAISSGGGYTCAVTNAGAALCWGNGASGELGAGMMTWQSLVPVGVSGLSSGIATVSAGVEHACALRATGGVLCWGDNQQGQLGDDSLNNSFIPVAVSDLSSGVAVISAGNFLTCAVTTAGAALCWGANNLGQLGNGSTMDSLVPVAVSGLSSGVAAISAGEEHACALTTAGSVLCWGANWSGQLGNGSQIESSVPVTVSGLASGVAAVSVGTAHTCAVMITGAVFCWGENSYGQLGDGTKIDRHTPVYVVAP